MVVAPKFLDDGALELRRTVDGRVLRVAAVDRGNGGRFDMLWRVEIRLSRAEQDDVAPGGAQFQSQRADTDRCRRPDPL